jgi:hypothetical protein
VVSEQAVERVGGTARVSRVKDEVLGLVYYVFVTDLPDELSPVRFLIWRCPVCRAEVHAWTLEQLNAVVKSHKKKHEKGVKGDG